MDIGGGTFPFAPPALTRIPSTPSPSNAKRPRPTRPSTANTPSSAGGILPSTITESVSLEEHPQLSSYSAPRNYHGPLTTGVGLDLGGLPSPFHTATGGAKDDSSPSSDDDSDRAEADYDWATFIGAYTAGRWDPHRTPMKPRSHLMNPSHSLYSMSEPSTAVLPLYQTEQVSPASAQPVFVESQVSSPRDEGPAQRDVNSGLSLAQLYPPDIAPAITSKSKDHRMRMSFSELRFSHATSLSMDSGIAGPSSPDAVTAAATMRWASARVNLAPLALPSPEHELTDPFRGVSHAIPHHPPDGDVTPGGSRRARLAEFWNGTQDVEQRSTPGAREPGQASRFREEVQRHNALINTIPAAPLITPVPDIDTVTAQSIRASFIPGFTLPVSASAPALGEQTTALSEDYFSQAATESLSPPVPTRRESDPVIEELSSVPALPRRICLTRQSSSPLPVTNASPEVETSTGRPVLSVKAGRAAKEEAMFAQLGYLAPPNPPDELERRRALYKFNIFKTGPDLNFDRIAHLAKLVFATKGVIISLIDGNDQWYKSQWGMLSLDCQRGHSLCAHAILQRGDEPMVVLDTKGDWRFEKNPLVIGDTKIRFYAGAPLRTQDGFNIGSLAVMDSSPRSDFSPRQRHTLKEFAAIVMREMELWRDKIQLRIREKIQTSMEEFSRECLEIDTDAHGVTASMDRVYDRAARLVKRTLDVEGVIVMDVSHCEVIETMGSEGSVSVVMHHGDSMPSKNRALTMFEYEQLNQFFDGHSEGKVSEGSTPLCLRPFLPPNVHYALSVPIFNIDKRPFALLIAYSGDRGTIQLEGHELSYLRAIGVIILSAVLKRRMMLADKAKSLFISNISHELRTPLHGILAAAELLSATSLDHSQTSFLQTVQACGTSLVETVNHLSGNTKSGGTDGVGIVRSSVNLMELAEEAVDLCWIGHRARTSSVMGDSEIGNFYSPRVNNEKDDEKASRASHVETVVEIGGKENGWFVRCERAGIRRVLMNLFGNSLKFTTYGYIHVRLKQLPSDVPGYSKVELSVTDTGKGISQDFLKNQLFQPFSQENPLQTGTGLGLAIVSSIVSSESIRGKLDVWSEEGTGTEIKITFLTEDTPTDDAVDAQPFKLMHHMEEVPKIALVGFQDPHKGVQLLRSVLREYLVNWWGFEVEDDVKKGGIVIVNDDPSLVADATKRRDIARPFILLTASRGSPKIMSIASEYERIGGACYILYKPGGPSRLQAVLKLCLHAYNIAASVDPEETQSEDELNFPENIRRNSEGRGNWSALGARPKIGARSITAHPAGMSWSLVPTDETDESVLSEPVPLADGTGETPTIAVGPSGENTLLASSIGGIAGHRFRVLVVEDNTILRSLLTKWLKSKGHEYRAAVDGRDGVNVFETEGPFDIVLLDMSMPILDGIGATTEMRKLEHDHHARILALTGMSSLEDKRRAFEAGVDGYLVKPVAFKTLDEMFEKLSDPTEDSTKAGRVSTESKSHGP